MFRKEYMEKLNKIQEAEFFTDTYLMSQINIAWGTLNSIRKGVLVSRATMRKVKAYVDAYEEGKRNVSNNRAERKI